MSNKINCLLIGYGNIGKIHGKYLNKNLNVKWFWYDPFIKNNAYNNIKDITNLDIFDKIFILTPEHTHYKIYKDIRTIFDKDIFVEKPAITRHEELEMLDDPKLVVGLVERFNPAIQTLKNHIDIRQIINIDFSRCCISSLSSDVSILEDIGIHDIDLFFYLTDSSIQDIKDICRDHKNNTTLLQINNNCMSSRFIWSKDTFFKERKITIRQKNCTYVADLQEQSVIKYLSKDNAKQTISESLFVEKSSPIENEQINFLSDNPSYIKGIRSHKLLLRLLNL